MATKKTIPSIIQKYVDEWNEIENEAKERALSMRVFELMSQKKSLTEKLDSLDLEKKLVEEQMAKVDEEFKALVESSK